MDRTICMQLTITPVRLDAVTNERLVEVAKMEVGVPTTFDWDEKAVRKGKHISEELFRKLAAQSLTAELVQEWLQKTPFVLVELDSEIGSHDEEVYDLQDLWEFAQGKRAYQKVARDPTKRTWFSFKEKLRLLRRRFFGW